MKVRLGMIETQMPLFRRLSIRYPLSVVPTILSPNFPQVREEKGRRHHSTVFHAAIGTTDGRKAMHCTGRKTTGHCLSVGIGASNAQNVGDFPGLRIHLNYRIVDPSDRLGK